MERRQFVYALDEQENQEGQQNKIDNGRDESTVSDFNAVDRKGEHTKIRLDK